MRYINVVAKTMARNGLKTANSLGCAFHFESDFNWLNRITLACKHGRLLLGNLHLYRNHQTVTKGLVQSEVFFNLLWAGTDKCRDNWPNHKPAIIVFFSCKISMLKACYFHIPLRTGDGKWTSPRATALHSSRSLVGFDEIKSTLCTRGSCVQHWFIPRLSFSQ